MSQVPTLPRLSVCPSAVIGCHSQQRPPPAVISKENSREAAVDDLETTSQNGPSTDHDGYRSMVTMRELVSAMCDITLGSNAHIDGLDDAEHSLAAQEGEVNDVGSNAW